METKLVKHGDDMAVILDEAILKLLNINDETEFEFRVENESIIIIPLEAEKKDNQE